MRNLQGFEFFGKEMHVQYARGKSDTIAKLDGTYRMSGGASTTTTTGGHTELQQQIFGAPPSSLPQKVVAAPPAADGTGGQGMDFDSGKEDGPKGVKRGREDDEEESNQEAPMDEDSDAPMEEGSDED